MEFNNKGVILHFLPQHIQDAQKFCDEYDLANQDFATKEPIFNLKPVSERVCRYCGKSYPETHFASCAHTFPQFLGNKFSLSDFECDKCNKLFCKYEKQLFNFIGPFITLNGTRGKKKIPNSPSHDGKIIAKKIKFFNAKKVIEISNTENKPDNISFNEETNEYSIDFKLQPYIPMEVLKAFIKIALGLMDNCEIKNYKLGLKVLNDKAFANSLKGEIFSVYTYSVSIPYEYTGVMLFKRRSESLLVPPYLLVMFYRQFMFQIFIQFKVAYLNMLRTTVITAPILPPVLNKMGDQEFKYFFESERLDTTIERNKNHVIKLKPDTREIKRVAVDMNTLKVGNKIFDPNSIVKFILIQDPDFGIKLHDID